MTSSLLDTMKRLTGLPALALAVTSLLSSCSEPTPSQSVPIGLLLSFSGQVAAGSINSERALLMAIESANAAGGVGGQPVTLMARDTQSDPRRIKARAQELLDAKVPLIIGPDNNELAVELKGQLGGHTVILPSFTTTEFTIYKPNAWFVMGAASGRVACELVAELRADGWKKPMVIADPLGYNSLLGWQLTHIYELPQVFLPRDDAASDATVRNIMNAGADAYVLAALPSVASALLYNLAALGGIGDPRRWYLSPTLHTPALLETLPQGLLDGASGVATGRLDEASAFDRAFRTRWHEPPLDDAYPFYDAAAIAVLALQRALVHEQALPVGSGLAKHVVAVTGAAGTVVDWNQIGLGLELLRQGQEISYRGLFGVLEFDLTGQSRKANTIWWTIGPQGFIPRPRISDCR